MLTGEIRSKIDALWNAFWTGGISNPMEVLEQITYLLFIRRLDDAHTLEEGKALTLKQPMENRVFPQGKDAKGRDFNDLRWSRFKNFAPAEMYTVINDDNDSAVLAFFAENKGDWQKIRDNDGTIAVAFGVAKVPETWIIDPNGYVRLRIAGQLLEGLLDEQMSILKVQFGS